MIIKKLIVYFSRTGENSVNGNNEVMEKGHTEIIATFIKDHNFFGKVVIPFCTNEEGAMRFAESELKSYAKGAIVKTGFAARGYDADKCDDALKAWLLEVL